ncbi:P-loop containing nucleoside triphosphate hydrolase [Sesbania bispinosa]|nr:P-loop containing nucleoside triphosphate hydrolase [Sesbania bispinosa]
MGGIGKTTLATVLYDRICYQFDVCCFIENVSKVYREGGAIAVQKQILSQTLDEINLETYSPSQIFGIGSNKVKAIILDQNEDISECPQLRAEGLSTMRGLIILILYHKNFSGSLNFLSNNLQYLLWHGYPFASLPLDFEPYRLVELNMPYSNIQRLWEGRKVLPHLKRVDLSNSKYLTETPNFAGSRRLEQLDLTGCISLSHVHPSIELLEKLAFLSLEGCSSLVSLDLDTTSNLYSLKVLHLSGCTELRSTPDFTGVSNLEYLDIDQCVSLSMVQSIGDLSKLKFLSLRDCKNLVSIPGNANTMTSLITLDLCGCSKLTNLPLLGQTPVSAENIYLSDDELASSIYLGFLVFLDVGFCNLSEVPDAIEELWHLERLNLEGNDFVSLPSSLGLLPRLAYLNLAHCSRLHFLPELKLCATASLGGSYFKTVSGSHNHRSGLYIFNCPFLQIPDGGQNLAFSWLERLVKNPCHFRCGFDIVVPGNIIPQWFDHQFMGYSRVRIAECVSKSDNWLGFAFCVAFKKMYHPTMFGSSEDSFSSFLPYSLYLSFENEQTEETFDMPLWLKFDGLNSEHLWIIYISRPHCHFVTTGAHITFKARPGLELKTWGLRMVFESDNFNPLSELVTNIEVNEVEYPPLDYEHESSSNSRHKIQLPYNWLLTEDVHEADSSSGSKFQLPYNWHVTEEEENESWQVNMKNTY